jgi:GT2 family glycosyltransferase
MRANLEQMVEGDERIELHGPVPPSSVPGLLQRHHAVVVPSLWECWPNVGLEALRANRPILATPVGGLAEMAAPGDGPAAGFLAEDVGERTVGDLLERVAASPHDLVEAAGGDGPRRRFEALVDDEGTVEEYRRLAGLRPRAPRRPRAAAAAPLVSIVVPYFRLDRYVEETVATLCAQTYEHVEVLVVNDGSLRPEDRVLEELQERWPVEVVTHANSGLGAARNFGIRASRGAYVLPFDADDLLDPGFVARCVDVLEADPDVHYVTSWLAYVDEDAEPDPALGDGFQAVSNASTILDTINASGSALAVFRRSVFDDVDYEVDLTSYEDWLLYRELAARGVHGHVIPERLIRYRVRTRSMLRADGMPARERLFEELEAHYRRRLTRWTQAS